MDDHQNKKAQLPTILINDLEVIEVHSKAPRWSSKSREDPFRRRKRLAAQHDLKNCGCMDVNSTGSKHVQRALFKIGEAQEDARRLVRYHPAVPDVDKIKIKLDLTAGERQQKLTHRAQATDLGPLGKVVATTTPKKRPHDVAFPSYYFDQEACLNFFRDRATSPKLDLSSHNLHRLNHGTPSLDPIDLLHRFPAKTRTSWSTDAPAPTVRQGISNRALTPVPRQVDEDGDTSMSDAGSDISIASVQTIDYNFNNSYKALVYRSDEEVAVIAPHKLAPLPQDNQMLHPVSAEKGKPKHTPRGPQPPPSHPLHSFYSELINAPPHAFSEVTGGLRRLWLHESRPQFFNALGYLQEYLIHKEKPVGLSHALWLWFCGREKRMPLDGPPQLALKVAIETAQACSTEHVEDRRHYSALVHRLTDEHGFEIEKHRNSIQAEAQLSQDRSNWNKMRRAEKKKEKSMNERKTQEIKTKWLDYLEKRPSDFAPASDTKLEQSLPSNENQTPESAEDIHALCREEAAAWQSGSLPYPKPAVFQI